MAEQTRRQTTVTDEELKAAVKELTPATGYRLRRFYWMKSYISSKQ
jgi:hypothetical protein